MAGEAGRGLGGGSRWMTGDLEETFYVNPLTGLCLATLIFRTLRDIRAEG